MRRPSSLSCPVPARLGRLAALVAALVLGAGCAPSPLPYSAPLDIRAVEVTIKEVPPAEVYYNRRQPPGVLGYLGTAAFMGSTIYRSWADSEKTEEVVQDLRNLEAMDSFVKPFAETLRESGFFRRVDVKRAGQPSRAVLYDAFIELLVDRWGLTYASEGQLAAEVVAVGRMRSPRKGEELLWRRRMVQTDGTRISLAKLAEEGPKAEEALRKTMRATGIDLARDLLKPITGSTPKAKELLPPGL